MSCPTAAARLYALLALCPVVLAQPPVVTETKRVENWVKGGGGTVVLRKINGRWWSPDNIEVNPPSKGGFFWTLESDPGVVQFFHHRPFQLDRAESLHLWMTEEQVEAALGQPNTIFGKSPHAFWSYFAADGAKLSVRFMGDGLGDADYERPGEKSRRVASIETDLNGKDPFTVGAERAWKKTQEADEKRMEQFRADRAIHPEAQRNGTPPPGAARQPRPSQPATVQSGLTIVAPSTAAQTPQEPPPPKRIIPVETLATVAPGTTREDVLSRLGEPANRSSITSSDGTRETFIYYGEDGEVRIRLVDGKVVTVR